MHWLRIASVWVRRKLGKDEKGLAGNMAGKLTCSTESRGLADDFGSRACQPFAWHAHEVLHLCKILTIGGLLRSVLTPVAC